MSVSIFQRAEAGRSVIRSGERTRLACWRRCLTVANFSFNAGISSGPDVEERLFRRDAETHARDARAPQICRNPYVIIRRATQQLDPRGWRAAPAPRQR